MEDDEMSVPELEVSVVVAVEGHSQSLEPPIRHIQLACKGLRAEVLVVQPDNERLPDLPPEVRVLTGQRTDLVPHLWARGIAEARGTVVALTTAHFRVGEGWARALLAGLASGAAGVGGPIRLAQDAGAVGRAAYFLRYAAFMSDPRTGQQHEIAGDNAAYARADLLRHADTFSDGFWEVEFHRRLRADGRSLAFAPDAAVEIGDAFEFGEFLRQRFRHGTRSGQYRARTLGIPTWRSLLAAPLVPLVLGGRILRHARRVPGALPMAIGAMPFILPMAGAWALGEAVGAWTARGAA